MNVLKFERGELLHALADEAALQKVVSEKLTQLAKDKGVPPVVMGALPELAVEVVKAIRQAPHPQHIGSNDNGLTVPIDLPSIGRAGTATWGYEPAYNPI
jgi:hypothetical protein